MPMSRGPSAISRSSFVSFLAHRTFIILKEKEKPQEKKKKGKILHEYWITTCGWLAVRPACIPHLILTTSSSHTHFHGIGVLFCFFCSFVLLLFFFSTSHFPLFFLSLFPASCLLFSSFPFLCLSHVAASHILSHIYPAWICLLLFRVYRKY